MSDDDGRVVPNGNGIGGGRSDEEDEEDVFAAMFPERVQLAIERQLSAELERLTLEQREKDEHVKRLQLDRENLGVELYESQQQLAKLQMSLEAVHEKLNLEQRDRAEAEKMLEELKAAAENRSKALEGEQTKSVKYTEELDKLNAYLIQLEKHNERMQSEIAVRRRATYKAEEEMNNLEKKKVKQDELIDSMQLELKQISERIGMYEAQLATQRSEKELAARTLAEASSEMEAIDFEKRQLLQQWKSSLIGLQRRDEALQAIEDSIRQQKEENLNLDNEISGIVKETKKEHERNSDLAAIHSKILNECRFLERSIESYMEQKARLVERYGVLRQSLSVTEKELETALTECRRHDTAITSLEKEIQKYAQSTRDLEDNLVHVLSEETTLKKGSQSTVQDITKLNDTIREKDMDILAIQNELARIRMDVLSTESHNQALRSDLKELESELKEKEKMIEKLDSEIRQKHDSIERKQKDLDRLNRKMEDIIRLRGSVEEAENFGPLEATIASLNKSISAKEKDAQNLQREWIRLQSELVSMNNELNGLAEDLHKAHSEYVVLEQKKRRMESSITEHNSAISRLDKGINGFHLDMQRMNEKIAQRSRQQEKLEDQNFNLEGALVSSLQDLEREAYRLEQQIAQVRQEKEDQIQSMLDVEQKIMLWEKKIQLGKETAEAIDPNVGREDINRMKKEIHIMELREQQLKRDILQLTEEMERAISKREIIGLSGRAKQQKAKECLPKKKKGSGVLGVPSSSSKPVGAMTQASLRRDIAGKTNELANVQREAAKFDQDIREGYRIQRELGNRMREKATEVENLRSLAREEREQLSDAIVEKQKIIERKSRMQKMTSKLRDAIDGKYKFTTKPENLAREFERQMERQQRLNEICNLVCEQFPQVTREVQRIHQIYLDFEDGHGDE